MILQYIFIAIWFFLPAGLANATPVFAAKIPGLKKWDTPMDFGKTIHGKRIFGDNKTWRGFCFGVLVSSLTVFISYLLWYTGIFSYHLIGWGINIFTLHDSLLNSYLWLGPLLGAGALFGDAVESFFKRQIGREAGQSWFPFDQIDYIIGGLLFSLLVVVFRWQFYLLVLVVWFAIHLISVAIGYKLGVRDKPI